MSKDAAPLDHAGPTDDSRKNRRRRLARSGVAVVCWGLCLVGAVIRLTIEDRYGGWAVLFYALPPAVMAGLALLAAGLLWFQPARRYGVLSLMMALAFGGWLYNTSYYHNTAAPKPVREAQRLEVMFWNAGRGRFGWSGVVEELGSVKAPLIGLVEAELSGESRPDFSREEFADYQVLFPGHGTALLVQGDVANTVVRPLGGGSTCVVSDVELHGISLAVVVVDIKSNPFRSRREAFGNLVSMLDGMRERPVLVMGDFNTPPDSVYFDPLRRHHTNAFEERGTGFEATWPIPFPVLSLDQVWLNEKLQAHRCELLWSWRSDHRPVLLEIGILETPNEGG